MFECSYLDTFDEALIKAEGNRPQVPALYNEVRLHERPIPRVEISPILRVELGIDETGAQAEQSDHEQDDLQTTYFNSGELNSDRDVKPIIDAEDLVAFENLFDRESVVSQVDPLANDEQNENDDLSEVPESFVNGIEAESSRNDAAEALEAPDESHANVSATNVAVESQRNEVERERQITENVRQVLLFGKTVVLDADLEYISIPEQNLQPIKDEPEYRVKCLDLLTGKMAFKQYVIY